jgi:tetratricopeptide (TPR) repeat protein
LLHQRAGEALQKHRPDDVAALARHFEQAEVPGQAARYAWQAGLVAKAVFAHAEARLYFDRALACLEQEATHLRESEALAANQRLRIQALDGRGWTFRLLGDMEAYARDSSEVARLAELLGDQATLAHLHWRKAYTHRWFCHYAQAKDAAEEGLHLSQTASDPLLEAMCQREVGMAARETGDYRRAELALERSLRLFVDLGEIVYEIHTLGNLSTLHWYEGEYKRAMNLARQALTRCDEAELSLERRLPLGDIGAAAAASGDVDLARQSLQESLDIARQITDRTQEILCLSHLGWLYLGLKQPIEALEHLLPALDLAERIGSCTEQSRLLAGLAEAHRLAAGPSTGLELVLSLPKEQALKQAITYARRAMALAQANGRTYDQEHARRILNDLGVS